MAKKKKVEQVLNSDMSDTKNIEAALEAADVVNDPVQPPVAKQAKPTVDSQKAAEVAEMAKRGNIPMKIKAGTEAIRSGNNKNHPSLNDGGAEPGQGVTTVKLNLDFDTGKFKREAI